MSLIVTIIVGAVVLFLFLVDGKPDKHPINNAELLHKDRMAGVSAEECERRRKQGRYS